MGARAFLLSSHLLSPPPSPPSPHFSPLPPLSIGFGYCLLPALDRLAPDEMRVSGLVTRGSRMRVSPVAARSRPLLAPHAPRGGGLSPPPPFRNPPRHHAQAPLSLADTPRHSSPSRTAIPKAEWSANPCPAPANAKNPRWFGPFCGEPLCPDPSSPPPSSRTEKPQRPPAQQTRDNPKRPAPQRQKQKGTARPHGTNETPPRLPRDYAGSSGHFPRKPTRLRHRGPEGQAKPRYPENRRTPAPPSRKVEVRESISREHRTHPPPQGPAQNFQKMERRRHAEGRLRKYNAFSETCSGFPPRDFPGAEG